MNYNDLKVKVLNKSKEAYNEKMFAGTSGNLSIYDRENKVMAITPTSIPYPILQADDVVIMDIKGNIIEGDKKPSSEWKMHAEIYANMSKVNSIVHTHSPKATGFAVAHKSIPVILIEMMFFLLGDVKNAKYAPPGSNELGIEACKALKNRVACLLENHGVVAVGNDIDEAYIRAVYTEDAAKIYIDSKILGEPVIIPIDEQNKIRKRMGIEPENN